VSRHDVFAIRRYYDRHTPGFLKFGQGGAEGTIHRAVWGPGVTDRRQAFHYVDDLLVDLVRQLAEKSPHPLHVLDLGCGVGSSLCYLAARLPILGTGVTISPVQASLASDRIRTAGLSSRVTCVEGDYTALDRGIEPADLAFAIESFVHGPSAARFLAECARVLRPGGLLAICDDFKGPRAGPEAERTLDRFRRGWRINTLLSRDELVQAAQDAGFELQSATDLTSWLELGRPRDRAVTLLDLACRWFPPAADAFGHLIGGSALQVCLARGWINYEFVVLRRATDVRSR
jgi:tocopherol O-methyltransferase